MTVIVFDRIQAVNPTGVDGLFFGIRIDKFCTVDFNGILVENRKCSGAAAGNEKSLRGATGE